MLLRRLHRWLTPLVVTLVWTAAAWAVPERVGDAEPAPERVGVLGYFLAGLFTVLSLVIICMPSRRT